MAWIPSYQELGAHPKLIRLTAGLEVSKPEVIGHLHMLWWWAMDYARDGDLSEYSAAEIAMAVEWRGEPDLLLEQLVHAGFIDGGVGAWRLHDWNDYGGKFLDRRSKDAKRMKKRRARERGDEPASEPEPAVASDAPAAQRREPFA